MLFKILFVISLFLITLACDSSQTKYKNDQECEELCMLAKECHQTANYDPESCTTFCIIEGWSDECLDCRFFTDCKERVECGYLYCDIRPSIEDCTKLCESFAICSDEYIDVEICAANCSTNRNMFECVQCLSDTECSEFIPCAAAHCLQREL